MSASEPTAPPRTFLPIAGGVLLLLALLLLLYVAYLTVRPVLVSIVLAAAVASLSSPFNRWIVRRLHGRRRLGSFVSVIVVFLCVFVPFGLLATLVIQRLVSEITELAHALQTGGPLSIEHVAARLGPLGAPFERALADLRPRITAAAPQIAAHLGSFVAAASRAALQIGVGVFLLAIALYYFLLEGRRWRARVVHLVPLRAEDTQMFFDRFHRVSSAVLIGNFGTALAQALAATLGYVLFGAPVPLVWGAATLFAALIPVIGPALIWLPVALAVGVGHGWLRGVGLAIYGVLIISTVDNVVRPLLTKRGLQLHPLLVFIAVFGGVLSFGFAGLFVGPLVMALLVAVLDVYERRAEGPTPEVQRHPVGGAGPRPPTTERPPGEAARH